MNPQEIYVSVDIESDGPIPGRNSMLSIGAVAFNESGKELGSFSRNLETIPEAKPDPDTMEWWAKQPEAWRACRENTVPAKHAMEEFVAWTNKLPGRPVFVAYPAGFDFTYVYWYLMTFHGQSPFSFSALDIKSFAMALLGKSYRESVKKHMPKRWFNGVGGHNHVAVDDARGQGIMFINMLKEARSRER